MGSAALVAAVALPWPNFLQGIYEVFKNKKSCMQSLWSLVAYKAVRWFQAKRQRHSQLTNSMRLYKTTYKSLRLFKTKAAIQIFVFFFRVCDCYFQFYNSKLPSRQTEYCILLHMFMTSRIELERELKEQQNTLSCSLYDPVHQMLFYFVCKCWLMNVSEIIFINRPWTV